MKLRNSRCLCLALALLMIFGMLHCTAFADDGANVYTLSGIPTSVSVEVENQPVWPDERGNVQIEAGKSVIIRGAWGYTLTALDLTRANGPEYAVVTLNAPEDVWEDGTGYQMLFDADANTCGTYYDSEYGFLLTSTDLQTIYQMFEYRLPEDANADYNNPNMLYKASATVYVDGGIYDYVMTNPSPGYKMCLVSDHGEVPGCGNDFEFKNGKTYEFTVYKGIGPCAKLEIGAYGVPVTKLFNDWFMFTMPSDDLHADCTVIEAPVYSWDFEEACDLGDWTFTDVDGDGFNWHKEVGEEMRTHAGQGVLSSYSYMPGSGALDPDNWAITPLIDIPDDDPLLSFWIIAQEINWMGDRVTVFIGDSTDITRMTQIGEVYEATANCLRYEIDLSAYAGQKKHIAFRHDSSALYQVNLDDVEVYGSYVFDGDVSVIPGAALLADAYTVSGRDVTVTYGAPCKLGYYDDETGSYIAIEPVSTLDVNTYKFTVPDGIDEVLLVVTGDVDLSGEFDFFDVVTAKAMDLGLETGSVLAQFFAGDVDLSGEFDFFDLVMIKAGDLGKTPLEW